jgi:FkbM family methyltransferase
VKKIIIPRRALAAWPALYRWAERAHDLSRFVFGRAHDPDFEWYRHAPAPAAGKIFLDVGANTGMSALAFRRHDRRTPILSIEANPALAGALRNVKRLIRGFDYKLAAAGAERARMTLYTPVYRGTPLSGEASLQRPTAADVFWIEQNVPDLDERDFEVRATEVEVIPLDDLRLRPAHVKIDVEGTELEVVRGLQRTLQEHKPSVLVERTDCFEEMRELLAGLGYSPRRYDRDSHALKPYAGEAVQNVFFIAADGDK